MSDEHVDVLVVGAGQAGLGTAYWLGRRTALSVLVLDGADALGRSWTSRWDSLRLFTPRRFSGLPGLRFPRGSGCPSKDEMAVYLQRYAQVHRLPVRLGTLVEQVQPEADGFRVRTTSGAVHARHVVVASGPFATPYVPPAAAGLGPQVHQLHSAQYCRPEDVAPGDVVVVGGGNSAAQLAVELARTHRVTVVSPRPLWYLPETVLGIGLYWWLYLSGTLNADADAGVSRYVRSRGDAIIGRELERLVAAGAVRSLVHRVEQADGSALVLADGSRVSAHSVLWCTGFRGDYTWLAVPGALDGDGRPVHTAGASPVPGLHWIGLPWQTRLNSSIIDGVDRDARALVQRLAPERQT